MAAFLFWLKKTVAYGLMPLPVSLILLVTGTLLLWRGRRPRWGQCCIGAGGLILLVLSHRQIGLRLLGPLESQYPAVPALAAGYPMPTALARCRYIVVLGGGHADAGLLPATSQLSSHALGRLVEAVRLARLLPDAKLITTGPGTAGRPSHAAILARAAQSLGVASDRCIELEHGRDTEGEAAQIRGVVGNAPFALVTSAWHMPRAMALMRGTGLHPYPCPADFRARPADEFQLGDWLWGLDGLERSTWAVYERLGLAWARLRGRTSE